MKKLQILALSMLLSSGYILQSSADDSSDGSSQGMSGQGGGGFNGGGLKPRPAQQGAWQVRRGQGDAGQQPTAAQQADMAARKASMATKKSANEARLATEVGATPTNESIAAFVTTIATDISAATAADASSIFASFRDAEFALNQLYPQPKSAHKKKGKGNMKNGSGKGDMKKQGGYKKQQTAPVAADSTPSN